MEQNFILENQVLDIFKQYNFNALTDEQVKNYQSLARNNRLALVEVDDERNDQNNDAVQKSIKSKYLLSAQDLQALAQDREYANREVSLLNSAQVGLVLLPSQKIRLTNLAQQFKGLGNFDGQNEPNVADKNTDNYLRQVKEMLGQNFNFEFTPHKDRFNLGRSSRGSYLSESQGEGTFIPGKSLSIKPISQASRQPDRSSPKSENAFSQDNQLPLRGGNPQGVNRYGAAPLTIPRKKSSLLKKTLVGSGVGIGGLGGGIAYSLITWDDGEAVSLLLNHFEKVQFCLAQSIDFFT
ncbi:MAG: hypothetical protein UT55_C0002G0005 [Candidatus Peregrinibacteria bacterium GW2011_GWE2_39_6]|nr:MAG: hypothetical protein UT36_C0002G0053 [Candidatus Peregrinibacteria bacterium GW2011_GWF2_39_17]KKR26743.1 MAG: hypothetical protein UT55_C0002G0005 [Candidatus Peregrinibacteria bacterium GW2011_GWE2_39_6]HCW32157.1 hypothetical protein [Candidatus Peregrinibacteria bacterium]